MHGIGPVMFISLTRRRLHDNKSNKADVDFFNKNGHCSFQVAANEKEMLRCLKKLRYESIDGSEFFGNNLIEVAGDPTRLICSPWFLPGAIRALYYQMRHSIMPIAIERGFSVKHKHIRLIVNRCREGYYQDWHHDNDGCTDLVVLAFFTEGGEPVKSDGGRFEIKKINQKGKDVISGSHLPKNGNCIALDTRTNDFIHRGELWRSKEKVRYFVRMAFRKDS